MGKVGQFGNIAACDERRRMWLQWSAGSPLAFCMSQETKHLGLSWGARGGSDPMSLHGDICKIRDLAKPGWCIGVSGCILTRKLRHRAAKCLVITSLRTVKYLSKLTRKPKWQGMVNHPAEVLSFCIDFIGYVEMVAGKPKLTSSDTCRAWQGQQEELLLLHQ